MNIFIYCQRKYMYFTVFIISKSFSTTFPSLSSDQNQFVFPMPTRHQNINIEHMKTDTREVYHFKSENQNTLLYFF